MTAENGRKPAILIVDDEPDIRELVATLAKRVLRDHVILEAGDVTTAERLCREHPVHAILTDLRMPGRSGIDLVRHVRATAPQIRCAIMTGYYSDVVDDVSITDLGLVDVVRKPFSVAECMALLRKLADVPPA